MRFRQHLKFLIDYLGSIDVASMQLTSNDKKFVEYYCKLTDRVDITEHTSLSQVKLFKTTGSSYDLHRILRSNDDLRFKYRWGDVTTPPEQATFVKNRRISEVEHTSTLLPLNTGRNYFTVNDSIRFEKKYDLAIWRGAAFKPWRLDFLKRTKTLEQFDTADTRPVNRGFLSKLGRPNYMSIQDQLDYKFIVSIEGNDAATNINWIMQTNSVLMMPKPRFETWFCEGLLEAGRHYIEIAPDYSDLEEVFEKYISQPKLCEEIIQEAKAHANFFFPLSKQFAIGREVTNRYRELTNPI